MTESAKPDEMREWLTDIEKWLDTDAESRNVEMIRVAPEAAHRAMLKIARELKELRRAAPAVSPVAVARVTSDGICFLRKQPNGDDWPKGTEFYAASPDYAQSVSPVAVATNPDFFTMVCDLIGIGSAARSESVAMVNIRNALRRADCLSGIESLFSFEIEVEDEEEESNIDDLLNWGEDRAQYVETFKAALCDPRIRALGVITDAAPPEPPLIGKWRFDNGMLCNGTLRIAREDFDTTPSDLVRDEILSWIVDSLNAAAVVDRSKS